MSPRACRTLRESTRARRNSAARRVFVEVGNKRTCRPGGCPYSRRGAGLRRLTLRVMRQSRVALTEIETLRFYVRSNVSQVKSNVATLRK
jgi:hypothetical protein